MLLVGSTICAVSSCVDTGPAHPTRAHQQARTRPTTLEQVMEPYQSSSVAATSEERAHSDGLGSTVVGKRVAVEWKSRLKGSAWFPGTITGKESDIMPTTS